ncbi:hypothetical protein F2Q69_00012469 [Brassica cretica]|uniref:Uncharacterized protein n=1 Tax=Brassica cretica TaxID=69181 RepID=A0A8S9QJE6_BRACR|nr:hypothetical protein F2Q69_00012469 [Brassica cretica]
MKEKSSYHPKRESRALQTRFGGIEERLIKYESDPRTVNFISILPLIQKEPGNGRDIIAKISMPYFHIIYPIIKSTYGLKVIDVSSWRRIKLLSCRDSSDQSRFCVYNQPGNEATLVKQMVEFRSFFVRAVKVHSAFPQVSSEPVAKDGMGQPTQDLNSRTNSSPTGTSPEQPQIATMKEKPSYHPKRESRALQTQTVPTSLGVSEKRSTETKSFSLEFVRVGAVCVYDQPGDEATLVKQMVSDRTLPEYHIDIISESSGVALLETSKSIRRFLRFLQNPWKRGLEDSTVDLFCDVKRCDIYMYGFKDVWTYDATCADVWCTDVCTMDAT